MRMKNKDTGSSLGSVFPISTIVSLFAELSSLQTTCTSRSAESNITKYQDTVRREESENQRQPEQYIKASKLVKLGCFGEWLSFV